MAGGKLQVQSSRAGETANERVVSSATHAGHTCGFLEGRVNYPPTAVVRASLSAGYVSAAQVSNLSLTTSICRRRVVKTFLHHKNVELAFRSPPPLLPPLVTETYNCPMAPLASHKLIKLARRCADGCQCGVLHLLTIVRTAPFRSGSPKLERPRLVS